MGRELKRVPLDFDWPLNKTWKGYVNPLYKGRKCEACDATGYSPQAKYLKDQWYGIAAFNPSSTGSKPFTPKTPEVDAFARRQVERSPEFYGRDSGAVYREANRLCLHWNGSWMHHLDQADVQALIGAGRLYDFTHTWKPETGWTPKEPPIVPTAEQVNLWSLCGMGHDSINSGACIDAKCKRLGYPATCGECQGHGEIWDSEQDRLAYEQWEDIEPPTGDGYQLWQTTSEGSPVSPVFKTLDNLCLWCEKNATTFGSSRATAAEWKKMLDDGFVCHREGNAVFM